MNSIQTLATFFGWCTVINIVIIIIVFVFTNFLHDLFGRIIAKMFGVSEQAAKETLLRVLMQYRVAFVVFSLVPYIALKIMA